LPTTPRRQTYRPPNFDQCHRLQGFLQDIKTHILNSSTTLSRYQLICEIFYQQMGTSCTVGELANTAALDALAAFWPTFIPLLEQWMDSRNGVVWGNTEKSTIASEIQLNSDLIIALENAPEVSIVNLCTSFLHLTLL